MKLNILIAALFVLISCRPEEQSLEKQREKQIFDLSTLRLPEEYKQVNGLFPVDYLRRVQIPEAQYGDKGLVGMVCELVLAIDRHSQRKHGQDFFVSGDLDVVKVIELSSNEALEYRDGGQIFLSDLSQSAYKIKEGNVENEASNPVGGTASPKAQ